MTDLVDDNSNNPAPAGTVTPVVTPTIDPPITMTPVSAGDISAPNNLARVASGSIGLPTEFTPVGAGTISTPNALSRVSAGDISTPNTLTGVTAGDISAPNTLNRIAAGSVATPNTLAPVAAQHINRALKPIISFDFGNQIYSKDGQPQTFSDITTFTRASTATFVETYIDNLSRKQKRIATAAVNTPRFEGDGLLVEGASTNLVLRSEDISNASWAKSNATVATNETLAPDESISADLVYPSSTGENRGVNQLLSGSAEICTSSFYVKSAGLAWIRIIEPDGTQGAWFNIVTGEVGTVDVDVTADIKGVGNGWFRCSVSNLASPTANVSQLILCDSDNSSSVTANGTSGVFVWGAQFEALPFATSYIKTEGGAVSRAAELISASASTSNEVTLHIDVKQLGNSQAFVTDLLNYGLGSFNRISLLTQPNRDIRFYSIVNGGTVTDLVVASSDSLNQNKITFTSKGGVNTGFINGENVINDSTGGFPTASNLITIGSGFSGLDNMFGTIKLAQIYDTALTASEVKAL